MGRHGKLCNGPVFGLFNSKKGIRNNNNNNMLLTVSVPSGMISQTCNSRALFENVHVPGPSITDNTV